MSLERSQEYLVGLISELRKLPEETEWAEFKVNNDNPEEIGEYISALSNTTALDGKANGYLIWGIENQTHNVVGTQFKPSETKKGNECLENWLLRLLKPKLHFRFYEITYESHPLVLLEIPRALSSPLQFQGNEFIRVKSTKQKLKDHPQIERELWRIFDQIPFEELKAAERVEVGDLLNLIDYPSYFELLHLPLPSDRDQILNALAEDRLITPNVAGGWDVTNLGIILFAKNLDTFRGLGRKAVRIILYEGKGRLKTIREHTVQKGYAAGFENLIDFINALSPRNEVMGKALRKDVPMYPEIAVRELVANALIHQDFTVTGAGPMVEIFSDRMEITNPGAPLVKTDRFLDTPPRSRNEALASFMRRVGICEERGSGVDKIVFQTEFFQLPAPMFETPGESTRAFLFAHKLFKDMTQADRVRSCYMHACLRYVVRDPMTNASLRERFGIDEKNSAMASRIIKETLEEGKIKPIDPDQKSKKHAKYYPFWA
jgi:predicted HTH transcriptional regulator